MIMKNPEADVIRFSGSDVVAASATKSFNMTGAGNAIAQDLTIKFNDGSYTYINNGSQTRTDLYDTLTSYFGVSNDVTGYTRLIKSSTTSSNFGTVLNNDDVGSSKSMDGTYTWDGSAFTRIT